MALDPFLTAPAIIQIHAGAATAALLIGPLALYRRQRDRLHRAAGYAWIVAMAIAALSAFGISGFAVLGPFGPIHLLACLVLWSLWSGLRDVRAGRVAAHRATFRSLYWNGLTIAGALTLLPGRTASEMLFPGRPEVSIALLMAILVGLGARAVADRRRGPVDGAGPI